MKTYIYIIAALLLLSGCSKEKLITYEGEPSIYFFETNRPPKFQSEILSDSTVIQFATISKSDTIQPIIIGTTSLPTEADRDYVLKIDPRSTAIEGIHYKILNTNFSIPKNSVADTVFIQWFKTEDMFAKEFQLSLVLEPNQNFATNMVNRILNSTTGSTISHINYRIYAHDMLPKPKYWLDSFYGPFTRKKFYLMCEVLQLDVQYFIELADTGASFAYAKLMQRYLNDQRDLGNIIVDEDGKPMTMGSAGQ